MVAHDEDRAAPRSDVIPLTRMPQQTGVWTPDDDWTGVISQMERRKLQNRQNQRAYRSRRLDRRMKPKPRDDMSPGPALDSENETSLNCAHVPPHASSYQRWFEAMAYQSYISGHPQRDHLVSLSRLNVHRAINENIAAIGMTVEWLNNDDSISIFNLLQPGRPRPSREGDGDIPPSLLPTPIQQTLPHHPWLDFFPFPRMRDGLIVAGDSIDDAELCHDLMAFWDTRNTGATLLVWGAPWEPGNWEVTEAFVRKWGWLLRGCPELWASSNSWRARRGERPLGERPLGG